MKKYTLNLILSLVIFSAIFLILFPYFTTDFQEIRQQKDKEEALQKYLEEQKALQRAEEEKKLKNYLIGKFDPALQENFIQIPEEYNVGGYKMYLRKETLDAFLQMRNTASVDGVNLKIASAARNFDYQKNIWNNKWSGVTLVEEQNLSKSISDGEERFKKILEYSAAPGTSRHHWGTDIDINDANPSYFDTKKGKKEYRWLVENAYLFGFCQTYNEKEPYRTTGYNEEKWHWSYMPLSGIFMEEYKNLIKDEDIKSFVGDEYVPVLNLIENYVLSINLECLQ